MSRPRPSRCTGDRHQKHRISQPAEQKLSGLSSRAAEGTAIPAHRQTTTKHEKPYTY